MAGLLGYDESPGIKLAPDLRRIVDEALFGSVWQRPALGFKDRSICTISAMTALRHLTQLRQHISAGLHLGLTPDQIVEIFIQLTFYVGVPTVEDALTLASEVFEAEAIDFTPSVIYDTDRSVADLSDLGARSLLEHIGDATTYQTDDAESEEMQLDRLINEYHWGAIYTRPHLDAKSRAICALSAMTVLGHYDRQMRARIEGALRVGVKPSEIMELFIHLTLYGGYLTTRTSMLRIARSVFTEQGLQEPAGEREHRASTSST
ncbi:MAG: hypothetical protein BZY87_04360 [SAR202 cluster bacterium Io17-Chloro-G6]|nr:MAG: hypothetical protein BZY87_04360 [SAR202 cluster bacterium Io17-Chloro-G6]